MSRPQFRPLAHADLDRLRTWLNAPHVHEWWGVGSGPGSLGGAGPDAATAEQVRAKYGPTIDDPDPSTHRFVIVLDGRAVGLIQHYRLVDDPGYAATVGETDPAVHGIDYLLGEPDVVGGGVGPLAITAFVHDVVAPAGARRVVAGPHPANERSCRALEKAGFVRVRDVVVAGEGPERIYALDLPSTARPSDVSR